MITKADILQLLGIVILVAGFVAILQWLGII